MHGAPVGELLVGELDIVGASSGDIDGEGDIVAHFGCVENRASSIGETGVGEGTESWTGADSRKSGGPVGDRGLRSSECAGEGPSDDLLNGRRGSRAASKANVGSVGTNSGRNIDWPRSGESFDGINGVGNDQGESSAVVGDVRVDDIATVEIDTAAKSDGGNGR